MNASCEICGKTGFFLSECNGSAVQRGNLHPTLLQGMRFCHQIQLVPPHATDRLGC